MKTMFPCLVGMIVSLVLLQVGDLLAASTNRSVNLSAQVASQARITLGASIINFVDFVGNSSWNTISANENPVAITAKARTGSNSAVILTFIAHDDLRSTYRTIPISQITWTAMGSGYRSGTMSRTSAQTVGTWTGSGSYAGTLSFFFNLRPNYQTGNYTSNGTFTLTAP